MTNFLTYKNQPTIRIENIAIIDTYSTKTLHFIEFGFNVDIYAENKIKSHWQFEKKGDRDKALKVIHDILK